MAGSYYPLHDIALTLAAVVHAVVTSTTLDVEALMRISGRLSINHGTDPSEIEDKLRGAIERRVRRDMAREILHLDEVDRQCSRNVGPWGDVRTSVRRIGRGEALPDWRDLHGGEGAEHG
jgi:hypothetical protein